MLTLQVFAHPGGPPPLQAGAERRTLRVVLPTAEHALGIGHVVEHDEVHNLVITEEAVDAPAPARDHEAARR
jgi:hypothetical protein